MLRRLAVAVFLTAILPIYGQKKGPQAAPNRRDGDSRQTPANASSGAATCVIKEDGTTIECHWPKDVPQSKFSRFFSPENAPNIGLFLVGLGGVIAAVLTLRSINGQAKTAKEALIAQFRPRIKIRAIRLVQTEFFLSVHVIVVNHGGTDALACHATIRLTFLYDHWYENCQISETIFPAWTLPPGRDHMLPIAAQEAIPVFVVSQHDAEAGNPKSASLQCEGTVTYLDRNGVERKTAFCRVYDLTAKRFIPSTESEDEYED